MFYYFSNSYSLSSLSSCIQFSFKSQHLSLPYFSFICLAFIHPCFLSLTLFAIFQSQSLYLFLISFLNNQVGGSTCLIHWSWPEAFASAAAKQNGNATLTTIEVSLFVNLSSILFISSLYPLSFSLLPNMMGEINDIFYICLTLELLHYVILLLWR